MWNKKRKYFEEKIENVKEFFRKTEWYEWWMGDWETICFALSERYRRIRGIIYIND